MSIACSTCAARNSPLCSVFDDEEIKVFYDSALTLSIPAGGYLLHEEDKVKHVYNVSSGTLSLERLTSDGARQIMAFVYAGDFVGITSGISYSVSGRALTSVSACQWHLKDLECLYVQFPKLEERIYEIASRVVAAMMDQLFVLGRKKAIEKITWFLLFIETKQNRVDGNNGAFKLPMTRVDIADYLGLTVETVSRVFTKLREAELIALPQAWTVRILDRERLRSVGGYRGASSGRKG